MSTQLQHYNAALLILGEIKILNLSEDRNAKNVLDDIWNNNLIDKVLVQGSWNFAIDTSMFSYETGLEPQFGHRYVFEKPTDFVKTAAISGNSALSPPLMSYRDEAGFWYADTPSIYVSYVSNHADFGGTPENWPEPFNEYVDAYLAFKSCMAITSSKSKTLDAKKLAKEMLMDARGKDAISEAPKFFPQGTFVSSRRG